RDTRRLHEALTEAFADHWGHAFPAFEQWRHLSIEGPDFDPELWFVAIDGKEIVGAVCGRRWPGRDVGTGVVEELAVRRAWRRRGDVADQLPGARTGRVRRLPPPTRFSRPFGLFHDGQPARLARRADLHRGGCRRRHLVARRRQPGCRADDGRLASRVAASSS